MRRTFVFDTIKTSGRLAACLALLHAQIPGLPVCAEANREQQSTSKDASQPATTDGDRKQGQKLSSSVLPPQHSNMVERPKRELLPIMGLESLSAHTHEIAEQLEILPMLVELYDRQHPPSNERRTLLREKIKETLLESFLDAASVESEAERELGILNALKQTVLNKRDRQVDMTNAANFIGSGTLNTIGSVLGFSAKTPPFSGNLNQMLSGVVSTGMSTYSLKQADGGKIHGPGRSTILAELFGRPVTEVTSYPESAWRFLHGHSIEFPEKSRVAVLEENWIKKGYLEPHGSPREQVKIDLVCGVGQAHRAMTVDDLNDAIGMISDVSSAATRMNHYIRDLLRMVDSDIPL